MSTEPAQTADKMPWLSLLTAFAIMIVGTAYPLLLVNDSGRANHLMALTLFWAMSAGCVHGIGFVPRLNFLRWVFSGWAVLVSLGLTLLLKLSFTQ